MLTGQRVAANAKAVRRRHAQVDPTRHYVDRGGSEVRGRVPSSEGFQGGIVEVRGRNSDLMEGSWSDGRTRGPAQGVPIRVFKERPFWPKQQFEPTRASPSLE